MYPHARKSGGSASHRLSEGERSRTQSPEPVLMNVDVNISRTDTRRLVMSARVEMLAALSGRLAPPEVQMARAASERNAAAWRAHGDSLTRSCSAECQGLRDSGDRAARSRQSVVASLLLAR